MSYIDKNDIIKLQEENNELLRTNAELFSLKQKTIKLLEDTHKWLHGSRLSVDTIANRIADMIKELEK